jgi:hypothetical protein
LILKVGRRILQKLVKGERRGWPPSPTWQALSLRIVQVSSEVFYNILVFISR